MKRELHVGMLSLLLTGTIALLSPALVASGSTLPTAFYLDIGGSASLGYQPTPTSPHGQHTDSGYADYLVALEAAKGVSLQLTEIGCAGETTVTMLVGGDSCYPSPDTQLAEAVSFLRAHYDESGLVTIDLGFNDIRPCFQFATVDPSCVRDKIELVREQLPDILSALKAAAGPNVTIVGVGHYDPYLAHYVEGPMGRAFAEASFDAVTTLDHSMHDAYSDDGVPMADVNSAFNGNNTSPVTLAGVGTVPDNVAEICLLTWMCQAPSYRPNIHPNDAGYEAIAESIAAVLPAPW
ncbi:MAG: SGNH/GDSL hydrolase family protein [Acidimicrobiales bacterium]